MNIRLVGAALAALLFTASAASADFSGQARVIDGDTFSIRQQRSALRLLMLVSAIKPASGMARYGGAASRHDGSSPA